MTFSLVRSWRLLREWLARWMDREITLAVHYVTLAATNTEYRIQFTLPADACFADNTWRIAAATCDQVAWIRECVCNKTTRTGAIIVVVPAGAAAGSYGTNTDLALTLTLTGRGFNGASRTDVAAVWEDPA